MTSRFHSLTWLAWALAAVTCLQLAPNVLYVGLLMLVTVLVVEVHGRATPLARAFPAFLALGALLGLVRVALTVLTTHGIGRELVTWPAFTLPRLLGGFTVGGTIEFEVLLQALSESVVIVATIAVFGAWNSVVSHAEVLQSAPRAFHEPGLIVSVALAFVPSTMTALRTTREADRARTGGVVVRRGRLVRLIVPVLERGMERAVALAESMDSRGLGHLPPGPTERGAAVCGLGALLALAAAFVSLVGRAHATATALVAAGGGFTVLAVALASRASRRERYRPRRMRAADWAMVVAVAVAPLTIALLAWSGADSLTWESWRLEAPEFDPLVAVALLALAVPAALPPAVPRGVPERHVQEAAAPERTPPEAAS